MDPDPFQDNADVAGLEREMEEIPVSEDGGGDGVEAPEAPAAEAPAPAARALEAAGRPPKPLSADLPASPPGAPRPQVFAKPSVRPSFGLGGRANASFNAAVSYGVQAAVSKAAESVVREQGEKEKAESTIRYVQSKEGSKAEKEALADLRHSDPSTEAALAGLTDAAAAGQGYANAANDLLAQDHGLDKLWRAGEEIERQSRRQIEELMKDSSGSGDFRLAVVAARVAATARAVRDRSTQISAELTRKNQGDRVREAEGQAKDAEKRATLAAAAARTPEERRIANLLRAEVANARDKATREKKHARSPEGRRAYAERKKAAKAATREARRAAKEAKRAAKAAAAAAKYGSPNRTALEAKARAAEEKAKAAQEKAERLLRELDDPNVPLLPGPGPAGEVPADSPESDSPVSATVECACDPPCPEGYRCGCQCVLEPEKKPDERESAERKSKGKQAPPVAPGDAGLPQPQERVAPWNGIVANHQDVPIPKRDALHEIEDISKEEVDSSAAEHSEKVKRRRAESGEAALDASEEALEEVREELLALDRAAQLLLSGRTRGGAIGITSSATLREIKERIEILLEAQFALSGAADRLRQVLRLGLTDSEGRLQIAIESEMVERIATATSDLAQTIKKRIAATAGQSINDYLRRGGYKKEIDAAAKAALQRARSARMSGASLGAIEEMAREASQARTRLRSEFQARVSAGSRGLSMILDTHPDYDSVYKKLDNRLKYAIKNENNVNVALDEKERAILSKYHFELKKSGMAGSEAEVRAMRIAIVEEIMESSGRSRDVMSSVSRVGMGVSIGLTLLRIAEVMSQEGSDRKKAVEYSGMIGGIVGGFVASEAAVGLLIAGGAATGPGILIVALVAAILFGAVGEDAGRKSAESWLEEPGAGP